jgi:hypothetical protein
MEYGEARCLNRARCGFPAMQSIPNTEILTPPATLAQDRFDAARRAGIIPATHAASVRIAPAIMWYWHY